MRVPKFTPNEYRVQDGVAYILLPGGLEALIDLIDLDRVLGFERWGKLRKRSGAYYAQSNKTKRTLHRFILGATEGELVDHENRQTLDCRRRNLRRCTNAQNLQNQGAQRRTRSGRRNVYWFARLAKWQVRMTVEGKVHALGYFETLDEADAVAIEGRRRLMPFSTD